MDPNNNLRDLRANVQVALSMVYSDAKPKKAALLNFLRDIAEDFDNLDEWMSKGGFLPTAWRSGTTALALAREAGAL